MEQEINDIGLEVILIYNSNMRSFEKISFVFGICFSIVIILFSWFFDYSVYICEFRYHRS